MKRHCFLILFGLMMALPVIGQESTDSPPMEPVIEDSASFVQVGMLVAAPSYQHPQSAFGHAFLRMQCPSEGLDYCFSMESGNYEGFLDICTGNYPNRLVCIPSEEYILSFYGEGRSVEEYPLNLRVEEAQRLWRLLDETCARGESPYHDFFHHGCSQELVRLLIQALDGRLEFGEAARRYDGTLFTLGNRLLPASCWLHLLPSLLSTTEGTDRTLTDLEKSAFPLILPELLSDACIVEADSTLRPLLKPLPPHCELLYTPYPVDTPLPLWVWFALALALTILISVIAWWGGKPWNRLGLALDVVLFVLYNGIVFTLLTLCLLSTLPTIHGWNWNFLLYNPLPLLVWLYSCWRPLGRYWRFVYGGYAVWTALFVCGMLLVGGHQIPEQYLLALCFGCRCLARYMKSYQ